MKTFDWERFKAKEFVVNCKTKAEEKDFLKQEQVKQKQPAKAIAPYS